MGTKLNKQAEELKKSIIDYLVKHRSIDTIDRQQIDYLITYTHLFYEQQERVIKNGAVQVFKNGSSNISGDMVVMNKAFEYVEKLSKNLGIYEIMKGKLHEYGNITDETEEFMK